jgi:hypothetical protein
MALTQFSLIISAADFRAYQAAARTLAKTMGRRRAPTACALMEFNLSQRDAGGIADDYLDSIGWLNGPDRAALTKAAGIAARTGAGSPPGDANATPRLVVRLQTPRNGPRHK